MELADVLRLLQSLIGRMKTVANIVLLLEIFQNADPNPAIPAEFVPITQSDPVRLEFFVRRIVVQSHIPWQAEIAARTTEIEKAGVYLFYPCALGMPGGLVRDFVRHGLPEQPELGGIG